MLPISVMPPFLCFFSELLTLDEASLASTESDGEYVTAVYTTDSGDCTVVTNASGELVKASSGDVSFETGRYVK